MRMKALALLVLPLFEAALLWDFATTAIFMYRSPATRALANSCPRADTRRC